MKGEVVALRARVATLERDLAAAQRDLQSAARAAAAGEARAARLEREIAQVTARLGAVPEGAAGPPGAGGIGAAAGRPEPGNRRAATAAPPPSCPAALPEQARKIRRGMKAPEVRKRLQGVEITESETLTLTGAGTRTRQRLAGPCFRVTFEGGRVVEVELDGQAPRRGSDRGRRRRR